MNQKFPKGAEWRKWDLHLHTPGTAKNDDFSSSGDVWGAYIEKLELQTDIEVLGITDYFSIENYTRVKAYQTEGKLQNKVLFPNIELRILPVTSVNTPINLHVIFDPLLDLEVIEREFFRKLTFSYQGAEYSCIFKDLVGLGRAYKSDKNLEEFAAWREGVGQFVINFDTLRKIIKGGDAISEHCLVGVSNSSRDGNSGIQHSSLAATRQEIYRFSDFIFSGNPNDISFFLGDGVDSPDKIKEDYGSLKPCLTSSDAHSIDKVNKFTGDRFTWIKADPTFEGLRQVINEPRDRVYIGSRPLVITQVASHRTKYISGLSIHKVEKYNSSLGEWFEDVSIPLNPELVAIIGNKGSGKSAIADIISLCSNYYNDKDFSFLTSKKFREKSGHISKNFEASLQWESGVIDKKNLNEIPEANEVLSVKYLPQGAFERLTNEIGTAEDFQREIEAVVFSHIPASERLNSLSFSELVDKRSAAVESEMLTLKAEIGHLNRDIAELERKSTETYKIEIKNKLQNKKTELEALIEPPAIANPNEDPGIRAQNEEINLAIDTLKQKITEIKILMSETNLNKKRIIEDLQEARTIRAEVSQKQVELVRFIEDRTSKLDALGVDVNTLISLNVSFEAIDLVINKKDQELGDIQLLLGETPSEASLKPLPELLAETNVELEREMAKLDSEQKLYQDYLASKLNWSKERDLLTGSSETPDTMIFFEDELVYLDDTLPGMLEAHYEKRRILTRKIFKGKQEVIGIYKKARNRLNSIIDDNSATLKHYNISVDAALVKNINFNDQFLGFIDKGKAGSFYSIEGGEAILKSLYSTTNFDNENDVVAFLDSVIDALKGDMRKNQQMALRNIADQVRDIGSLYDYLYSMEFLENNYQLRQGDKNLEQLSPGERGALLLVFYLLLDKNDVPLVIDQPEDNLDNHSVATFLVPFIRAAKKKRQIIMVTHNPNLAVVADAEQVIYVKLDKEHNYKFEFLSGSIEDPEINSRIVKVLEGTMPAFDTRRRKYHKEKT